MHKTTIDASFLYPIYVDEVLPGDTFNLRATLFGRLATPIKPVMDNLWLETFFFFVPTRLVWENWQRFNGEQDNPGDSTDYVIPSLAPNAGSFAPGSLFDYFGLPTSVPNVRTQNPINALPLRCYNLIFNEWFRDQNLQDSVPVLRGDAPDAASNYTLLRRNKRHDYFTQALPWPQKGDPVIVPLGDRAPIATDASNTGQKVGVVANNIVGNGNPLDLDPAVNHLTMNTVAADFGLYADLSLATGFTINQLRESFQIQKLLERDARGGTRYTEIIRAHFGVTSPDARLQRPEFLGGGRSMVNMNPIAQTSESLLDPDQTPQGNLAAYGTVSGRNHGFTKSFTEHGYIIGLCNVRADLTYQQGLARMWSRRTRYDFFWPALSHLGEQAILQKEIYASGDSSDDNVFGYVPRWDEYRHRNSQITGLFRSNAPGTLDYWHLSQDFENAPQLNSEFIQEDVPVDRVIAVPSEPHFILDIFFKTRCARPMPLYGVPGLIDHF